MRVSIGESEHWMGQEWALVRSEAVAGDEVVVARMRWRLVVGGYRVVGGVEMSSGWSGGKWRGGSQTSLLEAL